MRCLFPAHLAATWYMVGLVWFVQVVHYPLFDRADRAGFSQFHLAHQRLTLWVVTPPMLVEMATAIILIFRRPAGVSRSQAWVGLALVVTVWLATSFLVVPRHMILVDGFNPAAHAELVLANWVRTAAWSARGLLVLWMAAAQMTAPVAGTPAARSRAD